ncbi:MAG TPA: PQQ-dependent sugar dehydrogenase [Deltaproteobacteria bacterium]|jgi:quinoprotein glucose dehydrogenase|nr:PQQ-dependent sugar dehydrogenase [Deltaproteobacteria bacterium]HOI08362.1 PQQ-dependent sugar dehydrogenase [Deltaproteobacteria bacterium]
MSVIMRRGSGGTSSLGRQTGATALRAALVAFILLGLALQAQGQSKKPVMGDPVVGPPPQKVKDTYVSDPDGFTVETYVGNLEVPWSLVFLPDGSALVTERPGRIRIIRDGKLLEQPYAKMQVADIGEGGLMGLALHPDYPRQPYLYTMYTYREGIRLYNRVERLRSTGDKAEKDRVIIERIPGARVHDGGMIAFGPDGMLYVCTGDARRPERSQDPGDLGGKILRLTPDGGIPKDNPLKGSPVYAYGLRNPQGLAWDPGTGVLFASDHGPSGEFGLYGNDSIKVIRKGGNYGWPLVLGDANVKPFVDPIVHWVEATPPAGMAFFRNDLFVATLKGEALIRIGFSRKGKEYRVTSIRRLFAQGPSSGRYGRLRSVVAGPDGSLYVLTSNRDGRGTVRKGDDRILKLTLK